MNNIYMRFPGGRAKALTLSYDDGVQQDHRLISILNRHGLKCTFNINSGLFPAKGTTFPPGQIHRRLTEQEAVALYTDVRNLLYHLLITSLPLQPGLLIEIKRSAWRI